MIFCKTTPTKILTMLAATLALGLPSALADNESMQEGFADYNSGHYSDAMDHLQAALSTDFNNAKLHYYLANTYIKLNLRDAGIREFRISYALEPNKEVGKLSKQALGYLGVDGDKPKEKEAKVSEHKPPSDPILDKITATLQQEAEQARGLNRITSDSITKDLDKRSSDQLERAKADMQRDMSYYRRGRLIQLPLPDDALKQLDKLKQLYDAQKSAYSDGGTKHSEEIQKAADNLTGLLNEKGKSGSPRLEPTGTNLYIRNYKSEQTGTTSSPTATPPTGQPATKPSSSPK